MQFGGQFERRKPAPAQVQVSTELLEVSGMDSKDSFPKTGRNGPAYAIRKSFQELLWKL